MRGGNIAGQWPATGAHQELRDGVGRFRLVMKAVFVPLLLALLAGCSDLPRDPDRTSEHIAASRTIRIGMVPGDTRFADAARTRFLEALTTATAARPAFETGATEVLLQQLERGELDLVLTPLDPHSPWVTRVTPGPPLAERGRGERRVQYQAVMRNGENRWIMTVEKASRASADPGAGA